MCYRRVQRQLACQANLKEVAQNAGKAAAAVGAALLMTGVSCVLLFDANQRIVTLLYKPAD